MYKTYQKKAATPALSKKKPQDFSSPLTSTVRLTTIALSELSLAASLSRLLVPDSTKAFDFPELAGAQAAQAE
jgi:broad specificity phosphatase PhoE